MGAWARDHVCARVRVYACTRASLGWLATLAARYYHTDDTDHRAHACRNCALAEHFLAPFLPEETLPEAHRVTDNENLIVRVEHFFCWKRCAAGAQVDAVLKQRVSPV